MIFLEAMEPDGETIFEVKKIIDIRISDVIFSCFTMKL